MNNLEFRKVTREHSPSDPEEARRVEECGGQLFVIGGELRVNGVLNLTRALGDVQGRPMISNQPETAREVIERGDYLVLLACDGVSDVFDVRKLYAEVEKFVQNHPVRGWCDLEGNLNVFNYSDFQTTRTWLVTCAVPPSKKAPATT